MLSATAIASLIQRLQEVFLDVPEFSMTPEQAQRLFRIDPATCQALFDVLLESAVVTRTPDGSFVRYLPRAA
jgi:hypothetical protein